MLLHFVFYPILLLVFTEAQDVYVTIPNGIIKGRTEYSLRKLNFRSFQQIPYAKPPIGNLRFADPEPADKWDGELDATENTKMCFQQSNMYNIPNLEELETEDCLYLNVYTPSSATTSSRLPVMFYLFGGGFVNGASNIDFFGPHYLMEHDVIVVTINYRVGPFGFLTVGDNIISGNYGLKDQLLALEWVRDNIEYFGGDPGKVTIFGQSAGAASVGFQLLSKKSRGLFRAAIAQSGSTLSPWAYQRDYRTITYQLANYVDPNFDSNSNSEELLNFLREQSATDINTAATSFKQNVGNEQIVQGFWFTPVIENDSPNAFITENFYSALENGDMNRVPLMIGICSEEAIARAAANNDDLIKEKTSSVLQGINSYFNSLDLFFNVDKTQLVRFHNWQKEVNQLRVAIDQTFLKSTHESVRFLGIHIDESLNWKSHCKALGQKINSLRYLFINLREVLEVSQLVGLYFAQIDSRLRYGVCLWGNSVDAANVFIAQKRVLRCMAKISERQSCKPLFKQFGILPLPCLHIFELCAYVFQHRCVFDRNNDIHEHNTRQAGELHVPFARLVLGYKAPNYMGPKLFNKLPSDIKTINSIKLFRRKLKEFLLDRCFYNMSEFLNF